MINVKNGVSFLALALFMMGCSVEGQSVDAKPPTVNKPVTAFSSKSGVLTADSASIFFWPSEWTEERTAAGVKAVKMASRALLGYGAKLKLYGFQIEADWSKFKAEHCLKNFAVIDDATKPEDQYLESDEVQWKTPPAVDPADSAFVECVKNYQTRAYLRSEISRIETEELGKAAGVIDSTIGPENKLQIAANGTVISILESEDGGNQISITLKRFLFNKYSPSTENDEGPTKIFDVKFDPTLNKITFKVNGLSRDLQPTGDVFVFSLTRLADLYSLPGTTIDYALFQGDIAVIQNGSVIKKGSVSISGNFQRM